MEDTRHKGGHSEKREILVGDRDAYPQPVANTCEEETGHTAQEQAGSEYTSATAAAIGNGRGDSLEQNDEQHVQHYEPGVPIEKRIVEYYILRGAVYKFSNGIIWITNRF